MAAIIGGSVSTFLSFDPRVFATCVTFRRKVADKQVPTTVEGGFWLFHAKRVRKCLCMDGANCQLRSGKVRRYSSLLLVCKYCDLIFSGILLGYLSFWEISVRLKFLPMSVFCLLKGLEKGGSFPIFPGKLSPDNTPRAT